MTDVNRTSMAGASNAERDRCQRAVRVPRMMRVAVFLLLTLAVSAPAIAQGGADVAQAQALFDEGVALLKAGKVEEACRRLELSLAKSPAVGTRGKLAECYEKAGRTASAWAMWTSVVEQTSRPGDERRHKVAAQRVAALAPRMPRLVIVVKEPVVGQTVTRDGTPVAPGEWGLSLPFDPATVTIEAQAPDRQSFSLRVKLEDGKTVRAVIPRLEGGVTPTPPPREPEVVVPSEPATPRDDLVVREPRPASPPAPGRAQRVWGWVLFATGAATLTTGAVLFTIALKKDQDGEPRSEWKGLADGATACAIGGGVLTATGLILVWTAPSVEVAPGTHARIVPMPSGLGLAVTGDL
jgi:hypothetical protein